MSITYKIEIDNEKFENFSELVEKVSSAVMDCGREMIKQHMEMLDCELLLQRDKKRYRAKGMRKTAVKTRLGTIEYERRIYLDTKTGTHVFLLDETMNSRCIGLVDEDLCKTIEEMICERSYRETAKSVSELTGQIITHQAVWNIVQQAGEKVISLSTEPAAAGSVESKILYEEADGDWLKLQGKDREEYGISKEMKIGIAYDGVLYKKQKNGKIRRKLDNKVAYASFEAVDEFRKHCENTISRIYNTDEIELRIKNGDGANWIQKSSDCDCICVLDKFHRNKKITECVKDKKIAEELRKLLFQDKFDDLLECIEAYINSTEDTADKEKLRELYSYYSENRQALAGYYDRGITIPPTREPGVVHHARLGSMEGNVFTLIGNRMKGGRACWSVNGGNNLAALLCRHYTETDHEPKNAAEQKADNSLPILSAASIKETSGKGYEFSGNVSVSPCLKWLKDISRLKPLSDLSL